MLGKVALFVGAVLVAGVQAVASDPGQTWHAKSEEPEAVNQGAPLPMSGCPAFYPFSNGTIGICNSTTGQAACDAQVGYGLACNDTDCDILEPACGWAEGPGF